MAFLQEKDVVYMQRCLDLARWAEGMTAPNPMVGAVLVYQDRIIGEGWHKKAGTAHAEVNCFASVREEDIPFISSSTLYVSLEPCSHFGKTPPCVDLVLEKKVPRVVIAMEDPFPQVAGRGIKKLQAAGVDVLCGILEQEARDLNRAFLTAVEKKRPFITLKWAESADGFIDKKRFSNEEKPVIFSSPFRLRQVHHLRSIHDAILVGRRTVELDNPSLTNRYARGRNPIRLIIDPNQKLVPNPSLSVFNAEATTWIYSYKELEDKQEYSQSIFISKENFLEELLSDLVQRGVHSLLVEGGSFTLQQFIEQGLFDFIDCEKSPIYLGSGVQAPRIR